MESPGRRGVAAALAETRKEGRIRRKPEPKVLAYARKVLNQVRDGQHVEAWMIDWALRKTGDL